LVGRVEVVNRKCGVSSDYVRNCCSNLQLGVEYRAQSHFQYKGSYSVCGTTGKRLAVALYLAVQTLFSSEKIIEGQRRRFLREELLIRFWILEL